MKTADRPPNSCVQSSFLAFAVQLAVERKLQVFRRRIELKNVLDQTPLKHELLLDSWFASKGAWSTKPSCTFLKGRTGFARQGY